MQAKKEKEKIRVWKKEEKKKKTNVQMVSPAKTKIPHKQMAQKKYRAI